MEWNNKDYGTILLENGKESSGILFLSIIGEIEGHEVLGERMKSTKYEHLLPILAQVENNSDIQGILMLVNTTGGDCSCGLALAEMIASIRKPVVSLIIGDSHSIGVPISMAADYTLIAPTATMVIHPVRMSGTVIGAPQTFEYMKLIQDRILNFMEKHSKAPKEKLEKMMLRKGIMARDLGTILVGEECVKEGIADEVGGIHEALTILKNRIEKRKETGGE